jgi:predicted RNase H-like nuclease (RuvC/YqgF family)
MKFFLVVLAAALALNSCASMRAAPPPVETAIEYREIQGEIGRQQTDLAVTGEKIEHEARGIVEGIVALETSLAAPDYDRELLVDQAHALRVRAEGMEAETENLNRQLAAEREASAQLDRKFNEYEKETNIELSNRDTEINRLTVDNAKERGRGNTWMAIVITAVSIVVLYIVIKVLRALRIIPI